MRSNISLWHKIALNCGGIALELHRNCIELHSQASARGLHWKCIGLHWIALDCIELH